MNTDPEQLELLGPDDLDGLSWEEWFLALPLTPPSRPQPLRDRSTLFPALERKRAA